MKAYAWASGQIGFGRTVPEGALLIAEAPAKKLRPTVEVLARHAKVSPKGVFLVPGIPEATNQDEGIKALEAFRDIAVRSLAMCDLTADEFNCQYLIGTAVSYYETIWSEKALETVTRSEAWQLGHGKAIVSIVGKTGGVLLSHLHVFPTGRAS